MAPTSVRRLDDPLEVSATEAISCQLERQSQYLASQKAANVTKQEKSAFCTAYFYRYPLQNLQD